MNKLAILGASGYGKVVADCAECSGWNEIVFFDDAWPTLSQSGQWRVVGDSNALFSRLVQFDGVIVAIGNNVIRLNKHQELLARDARIVSVVHPGSTVSQYVTLGTGSVVRAGAIVDADSTVGECCIISSGATIGHDCVLADAVHVCPGAHIAGGVVIGTGSWIGIGSNIRELITIGDNTMIGAGSVVVTNVPSLVTAFGNPARVVSR